MIIKATFTGSDSLGYKNGNRYKLEVCNFQGVSIMRLDGSGKAGYSSLSSFLKNWTKVYVIDYT